MSRKAEKIVISITRPEEPFMNYDYGMVIDVIGADGGYGGVCKEDKMFETIKYYLTSLPTKEEMCKHEKIYSNEVLTSMPPQHPWICKKCGKRGTDIGGIYENSYDKLVNKFHGGK